MEYGAWINSLWVNSLNKFPTVEGFHGASNASLLFSIITRLLYCWRLYWDNNTCSKEWASART